ncbi:MAG: diguanylate cyclase [Coriobacteriia bacterium]|nr:diguanylate cyclase [Coriobacteriia bacterium]
MTEAMLAQRHLKRFTVSLVVAALAFTALTYGSIYLRTRTLLYESLRAQAATYHELIMITRGWITEHGGVWVEQRPGAAINPYFERLDVTYTAELTDGRSLVLQNPGLVTMQISERLEARRGVSFHLVSLDPINPAHAADAWERESLLAFEEDRRPRWEIAETRIGESLRYISPLVAQSECLTCHTGQEHHVGGVVGAATVEIPVASIEGQLQDTAATLWVLGLLTAGVSSSGLLLITRRLNGRVNEVHRHLAAAALTDDLTGLLNRRGTFERLDEEIGRARRTGDTLSVAMLDLDEFKLINDQYDHSGGDVALRHFGRLIQDESRSYDTAGRVGGEEFLLIAPGLDSGQAVALAERIRARVAAEPAVVAGDRVLLTVSIGVAELRGEESRDSIVLRADHAMYAAKEAGRDRVMLAEG